MNATPSHFKTTETAISRWMLPVESVSWDDCQEFCKRLSEAEGGKCPTCRGRGFINKLIQPKPDYLFTDRTPPIADLGEIKEVPCGSCNGSGRVAQRQYRLPSESAWEYACRAGTTSAYYFGNDPAKLGDYAWFSENSRGRTHPVGTKKPNAFGLYNMHGNVWCWCQDWYGEYPKQGEGEQSATFRGINKSVCGGGWRHPAVFCRSAHREAAHPSTKGESTGFRVVFSV